MYKADKTNSVIQLKDENNFLDASKGKALIF